MNRLCPACVLLTLLGGCYSVELSGMRFTPQEGWLREAPDGDFRKVQFRVPGARGGPGPARFVAYFFGPRGAGPPAANLELIEAQFEQPGGRSGAPAATARHFEAAGLDIMTLDVAGTYVAPRPGTGEPAERPGFRALVAVVSSEAGPYYLKLVGPAETVARWAPSWERMLESIRPADVLERPAPPVSRNDRL